MSPKEEPKLPVPIRRPSSQGPAADGAPSSPRIRRATVQRRTKETDISLALDLDGSGRAHVDTPLPFLSHMLDSLARHSLFDLRVSASGDVDVDPHHLVEDVGLCLGRALLQAIGDRLGMMRFGEATLPFDEALVRCYVDLGGRPAFVYKVEVAPGRIGTFDVELAEVFFSAVASEARMNLHLILEYGKNRHHIVEGCFKSFARALERAVLIDPRREGDLASTKGTLG